MALFLPIMPENQRIDTLYGCLRAVRGWYDTFFAFSPSEVPSMPFSIFIHLNQCQMALYRLTTITDPAWDRELVRNTADLLPILDRTAALFEEVNTAYPSRKGEGEAGGPLFAKAVHIIRNIKAAWEPTLTQSMGNLPTPNSQGAHAAATAHSAVTPGQGPVSMNAAPAATMNDVNPMLTGPGTMDFASDLGWMSDVFVPWEF